MEILGIHDDLTIVPIYHDDDFYRGNYYMNNIQNYIGSADDENIGALAVDDLISNIGSNEHKYINADILDGTGLPEDNEISEAIETNNASFIGGDLDDRFVDAFDFPSQLNELKHKRTTLDEDFLEPEVKNSLKEIDLNDFLKQDNTEYSLLDSFENVAHQDIANAPYDTIQHVFPLNALEVNAFSDTQPAAPDTQAATLAALDTQPAAPDTQHATLAALDNTQVKNNIASKYKLKKIYNEYT